MHGEETSPAFDAARQALAQGQAAQARAVATEILSAAEARGDLLTQARALQMLSRIRLHDADLRGALSVARQAAQLFHVLNAPRDESLALSQIGHLATLLGLTEEAVESAALSVHLAETLPPGPHTVEAYNYLGVAATWVDADHADGVLRKAIALAEQLLAPQAAARPMANRLINELYRLELCLQQHLPAQVRPDMLHQLARYSALVDHLESTTAHPLPFSPELLQATLQTARAGLLAFTGHTDRALDAIGQIPFDAVPVWMRGFMLVVRTRCHLAAGQWDAALATTRQSLAITEPQGQVNFILLSRFQRMEAYEALGDARRMMEELRAFRALQVRQQHAALASREQVVSLRMAWREQTLTLEALHSSTRALERLTLEDQLTGLANRRQLEHRLDELLPTLHGPAYAPWCLVMLDIDGFKQINDRYSHVLGDEVLRQVAALLRSVLRQQDLAVRLAGDEFVLVLQDTGESSGRQIVHRLHQAIAQFPWHTVQEGLSVRASIGLAQARPGDSAESLMLRSDLRMYDDKTRQRERRHTAGAAAASQTG